MHLKHLRALVALLASLPVSLATFAAYDVDIMTPVTPMSRDSYNLHWGILWVCVGIFFIVFGAMFWSIFKHRKSRGAVAAQFHENTAIEILWTIVPFIVLIGMAYPATRTMIEMKDPSGADMSIRVTGFQWRWQYDYLQDGVTFVSNLSTPRDQIEGNAPKNENYLLEVDNPVVVPVGKKVRLLIGSNDVIHGWYVPQLGVNQYGIPGFIKDAWFEVDRPGIYRGQCSQICGKEHGFMPIVVDARTPEQYALWVKEQKAKMPPPPAAAPAQVATAEQPAAAAAPAGGAPAGGAPAAPGAKLSLDDLKAKGEKVYMANCSACHQPTGRGMPPAFPALDGSKVATGPKAAHIATVLKGRPGTAMASWAHLSDEEIAAVVTYERNSWGNKTGDAVQPAEIAAARK
jgi:cytochrome c oxidase subunit 2